MGGAEGKMLTPGGDGPALRLQLTVLWSLEWVQLGESQLENPPGLISLLVWFIPNGLFIKY